jgi:hypothetical protein
MASRSTGGEGRASPSTSKDPKKSQDTLKLLGENAILGASNNASNAVYRNKRLSELGIKSEDELHKLEKQQSEGSVKTDEYDYQGEYIKAPQGTLKHGWGTLNYRFARQQLKQPLTDNEASASAREDCYEGHWWLDRRHGEGSFRFSGGAVYRGQWENDLAHGTGLLSFKVTTPTPRHQRGGSRSGTKRAADTNSPNSSPRRTRDRSNSADMTRKPSAQSSVTSDRGCEYWQHGVVLRLINTLLFPAESESSRKIVFNRIYERPLDKLLQDWSALLAFAQPPYEGVITVQHVLTLHSGLIETPERRKALLEFCARWYRDLRESEVVIVLPDLDQGCYLSFEQVIVKSRVLAAVTALYLRTKDRSDALAVKEEELREVFELCVASEGEGISALLSLLKGVDPQLLVDKWELADHIGDILSLFRSTVHSDLNCLRRIITLHEERVQARRASGSQLSGTYALPLLRLYRLNAKHLPGKDEVDPLLQRYRDLSGEKQRSSGEKKLLVSLYHTAVKHYLTAHIRTIARYQAFIAELQSQQFSKSERSSISSVARDLVTLLTPKIEALHQLCKTVVPGEQELLQEFYKTGVIVPEKSKSESKNKSDTPAPLLSFYSKLQTVWNVLTGADVTDSKSSPSNTNTKSESGSPATLSSLPNSRVSDLKKEEVKQRRKSVLEGMKISHPLSGPFSRPSRFNLTPHNVIALNANNTNTSKPVLNVDRPVLNVISEDVSEEGDGLNSSTNSNGSAQTADTSTAGSTTPPPSNSVGSPRKKKSSKSSSLHTCLALNARLSDVIVHDTALHLIAPLARSAHMLLAEWALAVLESESLVLSGFKQDEQSIAELVTALLRLALVRESSNLRDVPDRIMAAALYCLAKFADEDSDNDAIKRKILDLDVIFIFNLLTGSKEYVQRDACDLIAVLASGAEDIRDAMVKRVTKANEKLSSDDYRLERLSGALERLLERMKSGKSEELRIAAARALVNLCYNDQLKTLLCKQGALPSLLEFARQGKLQISKEIKQTQLQRGKLLGAGAFAKVYTGQYNHHDVAIKVFSESSFAFRLEDFYREVAIMSMISHPNVVRFEGACIEQRRDEEGVFMIVTELMHQGSLKSVVERSPLTYDKVFKYALEIAEGMIFLHSFDIIHRDLKSENVLISAEDVAKVADLGLSRDINIDQGMTLMAGTPKWEAPEVLTGKRKDNKSRYSKEADVYSYGMLLYEMVSGKQPFEDVHDIFELKKLVCDKNKRPKLPTQCPKPLAALIKRCWKGDATKRPPFTEILGELRAMKDKIIAMTRS